MPRNHTHSRPILLPLFITAALVQRTAPLCLHFYHGRPAAQAVGLDMYLTAKRVGWEKYLYPPEPVADGRMDWPCLPGIYALLIK